MTAGQVLQFGLRAGLAEGIDPKQAPPGTVSVMENCMRRKTGLVEKRWGVRSLASSAFIAAAARLFVRGDELGVTDGNDFWSYTPVAAAWKRVGPIANVGLTWSTLLDINDGARMTDVALLSDGRMVYAWLTGDASAATAGDVYYQIVDRSDGRARTTRPTKITAGSPTAIRLVASGTSFAVLMNDSGSGNLRAWLSATSAAVVLSAAQLGCVFDAVTIGTNFDVVFERSPNGIVVSSFDFATGTLQVGPTFVEASGLTTYDSISVDGRAGESLFVAYARFGTGVKVAAHDPTTLVQTLAPTVMDAGTTIDSTVSVCRYDAATYVLVMSSLGNAASGDYPCVVRTRLVTTAAAFSADRFSFGLIGLTRPFMLGGKPYVFMADYRWQNLAGTNSYLVAIETDSVVSGYWTHRLAGVVDVLAAGEWPSPAFGTNARGWVPNTIAPSATEVLAPLPFQAQIVSSDIVNGRGPVRWGVRLVSSTVGTSRPPDMWRSIQIGDELYWAAGCEQSYDGANVVDYGCTQAAIIDLATSTNVAGGVQAAGTYLYSTVPEYRSQAGVLHRGPTCPPQAIVAGASTKTTIKYVSPALSSKRLAQEVNDNPIKLTVALYRSKVGGTTLYRITVLPTLQVSTPVFTSSPESVLDNRTDADIGNGKALSAQAPIYTNGGELDDFPTPAPYTQWLHRNRIFAILGDRRTVGYSKDYTANVGVAPAFYPTFIFSFNDLLTAGASMDDKCIFWSARAIWFTQGDGPARNGQNSTFETPTKIQTDVGCISARSVVSMPDGYMFQSERGIYLLSRGLEVIFIGRDVQDELAAFPTVTSAVLVASQNEVRFTCNNAAGTAGIVLVFDYVEKQWSTRKYTVNGAYGAPIADAVIWQGQWTFVTPSGYVMAEDTTTNLDAGVWVPASFTLSSVSGTGPLGFQTMRKAWLLGDRKTDCDLILAFDFDDRGTFPQQHRWTSDDLAGLKDGANVGMRVGTMNGAKPRCRTFTVRVTDAPPTGAGASVGTGKGCTFSMVGFEFVPKPGLARRAARARA